MAGSLGIYKIDYTVLGQSRQLLAWSLGQTLLLSTRNKYISQEQSFANQASDTKLSMATEKYRRQMDWTIHVGWSN